MRDLNTVFCHQHSHSQPRYPHFTLCLYCREDAPHEAIVVEAAVNYFSPKLRDFFIETELEIQMGTDKRRADIVLVDEKQNYAAIVECKRIGIQADGIAQLKSYLCATETPVGVFANSPEPGDWEFFENLGRNQFKDITSDLFWKILRGTPEEESLQPSVDAHTYYNSGMAKLELKQYNDAIADFDEAIQLKPDDTVYYLWRGIAKLELKQYNDAIADFDETIQLKLVNTIVYRARGFVKYKLGQYESAIADFDEAIQLKPDDTVYYWRGEAKAALGEYNAAITDYDASIQLKPDEANTYAKRGEAKAALGEYNAAITDYDASIQLKPDKANTYAKRGLAYGRIGEYNAAIADYDTAIQLKPDYAIAYVRRGVANAKQDLQIALSLPEESCDSSLKARIEKMLRLLEVATSL